MVNIYVNTRCFYYFANCLDLLEFEIYYMHKNYYSKNSTIVPLLFYNKESFLSLTNIKSHLF